MSPLVTNWPTTNAGRGALKRRFKYALSEYRYTIVAWCEDEGITRQHLHACFAGDRDPSPALAAAVHSLIARYVR